MMYLIRHENTRQSMIRRGPNDVRHMTSHTQYLDFFPFSTAWFFSLSCDFQWRLICSPICALSVCHENTYSPLNSVRVFIYHGTWFYLILLRITSPGALPTTFIRDPVSGVCWGSVSCRRSQYHQIILGPGDFSDRFSNVCNMCTTNTIGLDQ